MPDNTLKKTYKKNIEEDEIDFVYLTKLFWNSRRKIYKSILIFTCIGVLAAIFTQKEYTASTTMVFQSGEGLDIGGNLGGLAAIAGVNLGGMSSETGISPALYSQIINSIPFQKEVLKFPLTIKGESKKTSLFEYYSKIYNPSLFGYLKKYTIGLPGLIVKSFKEIPEAKELNISDPFKLLSITDDEKELIEQLEDQIILEVNEKDGFLSLSVNMPEAIAAAELTNKVQELLQSYIIKFKIEASNEQLKFINERYNEKEKDFKVKQERLARFRDQNKNVNSALAQTKLEELQSDYDLVYGVLAELAKQKETQLIQVKKDSPVFTILNPVIIPIERSNTKPIFILVIWIFLGWIFGFTRVFVFELYENVKGKWNE